jgi:hypothetical protein
MDHVFMGLHGHASTQLPRPAAMVLWCACGTTWNSATYMELSICHAYGMLKTHAALLLLLLLQSGLPRWLPHRTASVKP